MPGPPILVTRRLQSPVMDRLEAKCDVTLWPETEPIPREHLLVDASGKAALVTLLTERVDEELLRAAGPQLRIVANYAVGFDNIDVDACTRFGVMVTNTPDVLTESTADMALALMLAAGRRIAEGDRLLRSGEPWTWGPEMMLGQDIHGKSLGIVGFGRIGRALASRAAGLSMRVVFYDAYTSDGSFGDGQVAERLTFEELLSTSDFVSLHVNLSSETRHLLDRERLRLMKPTAVLVNTSRGPVVDEAALAEALARDELFAAGLDVFEKEPEAHPALLSNPRAVIVPHLGSATVDTRLAMGMLAADNVLAAVDGERPPTLVNPETWERAAER